MLLTHQAIALSRAYAPYDNVVIENVLGALNSIVAVTVLRAGSRNASQNSLFFTMNKGLMKN